MESGVQSKCFICAKVFDAKSLAEHERECLTQLQEGLTNITKEVDTLLDFESESVLSATSSGSNENSRKTVRCYICGEDFAPHFISVHERQCKRRWDSGVSSTDTIKKGASLGHIPAIREIERGKHKDEVSKNNIRKAQSVANIAHQGPKQAWNARIRDKGSKENLHAEKSPRSLSRTKRKERPKSAYVTSSSSHDVSADIFSPKEFGIYDDINDADRNASNVLNEKAVSLQDLTSNGTETPKQKAAAPKFIECQYCFKMFSIHSIHIHEKKCLSRRDLTTPEKGKSKKISQSNGRCISVNELRSAKDDDDWLIEKQLDSSLAVSVDNLNTQKDNYSDSPRFLLCSYCSRPFGSKSLPIHLPQCQKKYEREQAEKENPKSSSRKSTKGRSSPSVNGFAKKTALRHSLSSPPFDTGNSSFAFASPQKSSNPPKTLNSLTPSPSNRKAYQGKQTPNGHRSPNASAYVACQFCKNYYGSASVKIHEAKCETKMQNKKETKPATKPIGRPLDVSLKEHIAELYQTLREGAFPIHKMQ